MFHSSILEAQVILGACLIGNTCVGQLPDCDPVQILIMLKQGHTIATCAKKHDTEFNLDIVCINLVLVFEVEPGSSPNPLHIA